MEPSGYMNYHSSTHLEHESCSNQHSHNKPHSYELKLLSDEDLLATAECIYDMKQLKSKKHTLDSGLFGASQMNSICTVCMQPIEKCIGHFSVVMLPFPIIKALCIKDTKTLIQMVCPCCSRLLIPNARDALTLPQKNRLAFIKKETEKYVRKTGSELYCIHCKNKVQLIKAYDSEPLIRFRFIDQMQTLINPTIIYDIFNNFTETAEIGYNDSFHPRNFMTYILPLVPTKLRPKNVINTESTITSYYKSVIEEIVPELNNVKKTLTSRGYLVNISSSDTQTKFLRSYDKLCAFYMLITDISTDRVREASLQMIEKRDRKHVDPHNALIGRIKGKETSIFNKGIVATRHNVSARTVLGGAVDAKIKEINVPYHVANKLSMYYPVYKQNLKFMKQLIIATNLNRSENENTNDILKRARVINVLEAETGRLHKINSANASYRSSMLKPGDKISLSLIDTDIVTHTRFPVIREESLSTFQVKKDNNDIVCIPLAACEYKMADMDGDETQIYVGSGHYLDVESILLNSSFAQYISYKNGDPGMWYPWSGDAAYGLQKITNSRTCIIRDDKESESYKIIDRVNKLLPSDLSYKDSKIHIVNGKILSEKPTIRNVELFKYINSIYGSEFTLNLMDELTKIAYDLNRDEGCTLGYDIKITHPETKKKIKAINKATEEKMIQNEISNMENKDIMQLLAVDNQKCGIKEMLIEDAKGTNNDRAGYTTLRQEEFYQTVAMVDAVNIDGMRIQPVLANGMRTCSAYPRNSIDPSAYGFINGCYSEGLSTVNHFFEAKQHRYNIYQKGVGTADQGYTAKRFILTYGRGFMDFNGALISTCRNISTMYGVCGINPRLCVQTKLRDIGLDRDEFMNKYSDDEVLCELYDEMRDIRRRYARMTCFVKDDVNIDTFLSGFHYEQYLNASAKQIGKGDKVDVKVIDEFIEKMRNIFLPGYKTQKSVLLTAKMLNLQQHEYYFRTLLRDYVLTDDIQEYLLNRFKWSLADGGDAIGYKACLATTEPLTQSALHAIHSLGAGAGVERIVRSSGLTRYNELLIGNKHKDTVVSLKLFDDSEESCRKFANEQETFYLNDIWVDMNLLTTQHVNKDGEVINDDVDNIPVEIKNINKDFDWSGIEVSKNCVVMTWELNIIGSYYVHVTDVMNRLYENYPEIAFITGYMIDLKHFKAYVFFKSFVDTSAVLAIMDQFGQNTQKNIINGGYLKNCFVYKDKNTNDGGEHYLIDANESVQGNSALEILLYDDRVDPRGSRSTNVENVLNIYGLCETQTRHYEELIYCSDKLSATKGVLSRHYKVLSDTTFAGGDPIYGSRNSLKNDTDIDSLRLINFETPREMISQTLKYAGPRDVNDPISANVFGDLPCLGTGVSKITLIKKH